MLPEEQTRVFLERVLPWPPLGDPNAFFNIHYPTKLIDKRTGRNAYSGLANETLDQMMKAVKFAMSGRNNVGDVYVCMSSQRVYEPMQSANGFQYKKGRKSAQNAANLRTFFIDVDVKPDKPGKAYASTQEAIAALRDFLRASGMPRPSLIVFSGTGGIHCHWTLTQALTRQEWQPYADALAELTRKHGFKVDPQRTADSASLMRVPGTFNFKRDQPLPVTLAKSQGPDYELSQLPLSPAATLISPKPNASVSMFPGALDALAGGVQRESRPVVLDTVAQAGCGFIKDALDTGGKDYAEPLWHLTTLAAVFAENGREKAHEMAQGHASYAVEDTDALFDRKLKEREEKNLGWPSCRSIQNAGCKACATCPYLSHGKSPLHLGKTATMPNTAEEDLPSGYVRDPNTKVIQRVHYDDNSNATTIPLVKHGMYDPWIQANPYILHFTCRDLLGRVTSISVPFEMFSAPDVLGKHLNSCGMQVTRGTAKILGDFLVSWVEKLREKRNAIVTSKPFGWVDENGKITGFSYGGRVWSPGGDRPAATSEPVIDNAYRPCGEMEKWKIAANMITDQRRPALDMILALSFAAPLMRFTGETGAIVSTYSSDSGVGKSTAIKVAQAVWGSPKKGVQGLDDTINSVGGKIGTLRHLPMFWDELKTEDTTKRFVEFAFKISSGKEKSRMRADATQRDPGDWQTLLLAATNDSLVDFIAANSRVSPAGLYRVFEALVPPGPPTMLGGDAARITGTLEHHFGQAGLVYAKFLGEQSELVANEVISVHNSLCKKLDMKNDERLWFASMATIVAGARFANKLNLTQIQVKPLLVFLVEVLGKLRQQRERFDGDMNKSDNVSAVLARFLNAQRARHMIVTDIMPLGRGRPQKVKILNDVSRLETAYAHLGIKNHTLRFSSVQFGEWLKNVNLPRSAIMEALEREYQVRRLIGVSLGAGTDFSGFREQVLEIIMPRSEIETIVGADMLDDADGAGAQSAETQGAG